MLPEIFSRRFLVADRPPLRHLHHNPLPLVDHRCPSAAADLDHCQGDLRGFEVIDPVSVE
jgi:hypothetical protein